MSSSSSREARTYDRDDPCQLAKLYTARSGLVMIVIAVSIALVLCLIAALVNDFTSDPPAETLLSISQFSIVFVAILGVMASGEFRHGSIAPSPPASRHPYPAGTR